LTRFKLIIVISNNKVK